MNTTHHPRPAVPEWSSVGEALRLIALGYTFRTCFRVALVVGTLLSIVNQGSVILAGEATASTAIRIAINYLIPFVVSSIGYLAPFRTTRATTQR
ncbi:MAG: nitrate/nitrite transporter NrtS [Ilumatobacteraceae bacterium]